MGLNSILGAIDFDLLSEDRQKSQYRNLSHPLCEKDLKSVSGYIRNILPGGNLSDLANIYGLEIGIVILLSNLCNSYKELNTHLSASKDVFKVYSEKKIIYIIQVFGISNIPKLIKCIESFSGSLYLPLEILKAILSLPTGEEKYDSFKNIIKECSPQYIPLAISTYLSRLDSISPNQKQNFQKVASTRIPCLVQFILLSDTLGELLQLLQNENVTSTIILTGEIRLGIIINLCNSITDFIDVINDPDFIGNVSLANISLFRVASGLSKNIQDLKRTLGNRYMLGSFNVSCSKTLSDMIQASIHDDTFDELVYIKTLIGDFLDTKDIEKPEEMLDYGDFELNIYVRLGGGVNHPEIVEALILFVQEYIDRGGSKIFGRINVIPRHIENKPHKELFNHNRTEYLEVSGVSFNNAMDKKKTACIYLSHSTLSHNDKIPSIISGGMENHRIQNAVVSSIELEDSRDRIGFAFGENLEAVLEEFLGNLRDLENNILALQEKLSLPGIIRKYCFPFPKIFLYSL